jgi:hypothetical protein
MLSQRVRNIPDAGGCGERIEADVPLRPVCEVVVGDAKRPVVAGAQRTSPGAHGGGALDQGAQPLCETLVALEARGGGRLERDVHLQEAPREFAIR